MGGPSPKVPGANNLIKQLSTSSLGTSNSWMFENQRKFIDVLKFNFIVKEVFCYENQKRQSHNV